VLKSGEARECWDAEAPLVQLGEPAVLPLIQVLVEGNPPGQYSAARALGKIGDPRAVAPLMEALRHDSGRTYDCIEWYAAEALARIGEPALGPLLDALTDENAHVRRWSAAALGEMGEPLAVEPLLAALADPEREVQFRVLIALGQIGDWRAIGPLVKLMEDEAKEESVRMHAVSALGRCVKGEVFEPLVNLLNAPGNLRIAAVHALAISAGVQVLDLLMGMMGDADPCVRSAAIQQLGRLGDERALPALKKAGEHDQERCGDRAVQSEAAFAIERIRGK
jgi:HEAT repeat protein